MFISTINNFLRGDGNLRSVKSTNYVLFRIALCINHKNRCYKSRGLSSNEIRDRFL